MNKRGFGNGQGTKCSETKHKKDKEDKDDDDKD